MKRHYGGETVKQGVYLDLSIFELNHLYKEPAVLPGLPCVEYVRVPASFALLLGPLAGLGLIIFLPLVGIIGIIYVLIYRVERAILALGRKLRPYPRL